MKQLATIAAIGLMLGCGTEPEEAPQGGFRASAPTARVFPLNPVATPEPQTVIFHELPAGATTLEDADLQVKSCVDTRQCRRVKTVAGVRDVHFCATEAKANRKNGTFLHVKPAQGKNATDQFAEVQAYAHGKTALRAFREWAGDPAFKLRNRVLMVVNYRPPDLASEASACAGGKVQQKSQLVREDNAYFWAKGEMGPVDLGDRVMLGQGPTLDYAYDGEVVYHEMVHALMRTLTPLAWFHRDELGIDYSLGGLHEGFSDYFAAAISGNGLTSLYAGDGEPLGDHETFRHCKDGLTGEEHTESLAFTNALWSIRKSLRSKQKRLLFNQALFRALTALEASTGMSDAVEIILGELDPAQRDVARRKFVERGLLQCGQRVVPLGPDDAHSELYVRGPNTVESLGPAGIQFRVELAEARDALHFAAEGSFSLTFELVGAGMPDAADLQVLVKPGTTPITWSWDTARGEHDAPFSGDLVIDADSGRASATVSGPFPPGIYHVQVVNAGADWGLESFGLASDRRPARPARHPDRRPAPRHFRPPAAE